MGPRSLNGGGRFRAMIGVGGIGTGTFFALNGNRTVGREESRSGRFLDRRDYCKLHIVSHYVKALLGPDFAVFPVGKVGDDEAGRKLWSEMEEAGLDLRYVEKTREAPTLYSFCFVYPDGSGGNFTTDDSACARVTPDFVSRAEGAFERCRGEGVALAVPEAPLAARLRLLELGTEYGFFRAASFSSKELDETPVIESLGMVDLLAMNMDEAARIAAGGSRGRGETRAGGGGAGRAAETAIAAVSRVNPGAFVSVTAGKRGSWVWDGRRINHVPAPEVEAVSAAGAGDAFLAGLIAGIHANLRLPEAQELATLAAAFSVTSPHTIHKGMDRPSLAQFSEKTGFDLSASVRNFLFCP